MPVITTRAKIYDAIRALHEALLLFHATPERYKYHEVIELNKNIEFYHEELEKLALKAKFVHKRVLEIEGKNPDSVK